MKILITDYKILLYFNESKRTYYIKVIYNIFYNTFKVKFYLILLSKILFKLLI